MRICEFVKDYSANKLYVIISATNVHKYRQGYSKTEAVIRDLVALWIIVCRNYSPLFSCDVAAEFLFLSDDRYKLPLSEIRVKRCDPPRFWYTDIMNHFKLMSTTAFTELVSKCLILYKISY